MSARARHKFTVALTRAAVYDKILQAGGKLPVFVNMKLTFLRIIFFRTLMSFNEGYKSCFGSKRCRRTMIKESC